jgi:quinol-cytochrome oxidoreductase complex cytochrome b subunit
MQDKLEKLIEAIDERTGLRTNIQHFLFEEIPASSGWHQVFGSVALFLFLVQFFTGSMLAFNYAPTPGDAYDSVRYIMTEVTGGRLMRGLHHWGASAIIVIVVLHLIQVFIWGAYKKPREATWIVGVVLLLMTLAFGLSGYLLPWDNRAYWGTTVTTRIGATAPGAGPYISRLLASTGDIGVVTFARFYAAHVLLLPPISLLLIVFHVYLVRRHGVAAAPGDEKKPKKMFFPEQVYKDTVAVFVAFVILFCLASFAKMPLEHVADPTNSTYTPRPEWYFLFLFQMLKVFEGPLEIVGTMILPTLAILALILTPFIDRSTLVKVRQRTLAMGVVLLAGLGWGGLTLAAIKGTPPQTEANEIDYAGPVQWMGLTAPEQAGILYFKEAKCGTCHASEGQQPAQPGTILTAGGNKRNDAAWLTAHLKDKSGPANLTDPQIRDLSALVLKINTENGDLVTNAPKFAPEGAALYEKNTCGACHMLNGVGGKIGPALNGLSKRRTEAWAIEHFQNPQKMSPGSPMRPYPFTKEEMQSEVSYLMTLPDNK